jgi:hypothetical protein
MPSRRSWPKGLRIIFWVTVLGFVIGTGQLLYFFFISHRGLEYLETYFLVLAFGDYALALAGVIVGFSARRKLFSIFVLLERSLSGAVTFWLTGEMLRIAFPDMISRPFSPKTYVTLIDWYFIWNSIQLGINALIIFYICYHELRRNQSAPGPL